MRADGYDNWLVLSLVSKLQAIVGTHNDVYAWQRSPFVESSGVLHLPEALQKRLPTLPPLLLDVEGGSTLHVRAAAWLGATLSTEMAHPNAASSLAC